MWLTCGFFLHVVLEGGGKLCAHPPVDVVLLCPVLGTKHQNSSYLNKVAGPFMVTLDPPC